MARLEEDKQKKVHWRRFGTYLPERQWGTVREDYSAEGNPWTYLTYDEARYRAYRWGEEGIGGLCDNHCRLCFAFSFWNGQDSHVKERLFGLSNPQGNHGEDIKEIHYFLDNTPLHTYARYLYKYPQNAFPYEKLIQENARRTQKDPEYELIDTGLFDADEYFDLMIEYAKIDHDDMAIRIRCSNRAPHKAPLYLMPTLFCRNTWSWKAESPKPKLASEGETAISISIPSFGEMMLYLPQSLERLFTENETNHHKLYGTGDPNAYAKDGINTYLVEGKKEAINPKEEGTKAAFLYRWELEAGEERVFTARLSSRLDLAAPLEGLDAIFEQRREEADRFYDELYSCELTPEHKSLKRQALAGMLWNKQYYNYIVEEWLEGDPLQPRPPIGHKIVRNWDWLHLYSDDVLSVPDKWEYPGLFSWDSAFHALPLAVLDPEFAKRQLTVMTREWYMHPSGQLPAYEWNFDDVNPPVHAWAGLRVYQIEKKMRGKPDVHFLESLFQKLLLNFTWWVNRKDSEGKNIFKGGFLGLDNISVFNRSDHLPPGCTLYQSDATSWMGMYCLNMFSIALELSEFNQSYEDMASKFFEHFLHIAAAMNYDVQGTHSLWDEEDGFYYDIMIRDDGSCQHLKTRSLVGLIPLFAVATIKPEVFERAKGFSARMQWFLEHRKDLINRVICTKSQGIEGRRILSLVTKDRLKRVLSIMLDESEFLSPYGIRSLSKRLGEHPYTLNFNSHSYSVDYEPAESTLRLFGGNSNWRGPIWFPVNILIIESLQKFDHYLGRDFKVECPTGSGQYLSLWDVAAEISRRLLSIFEVKDQTRPLYGKREKFQKDPHFAPYTHFFEYFNAETGEGLGANHQTGWTGLVAKLIKQLGDYHKI